jgi:biopolymer transport protein ExbD
MLQKTLDMQVPKKEKATANNAPLIILQIFGKESFALNQKALNRANLEAELRKVYSVRDDDLLFVKPEGADVTFGDVTWAMDRAKGAGVRIIGTVLNDPADGG